MILDTFFLIHLFPDLAEIRFVFHYLSATNVFAMDEFGKKMDGKKMFIAIPKTVAAGMDYAPGGLQC